MHAGHILKFGIRHYLLMRGKGWLVLVFLLLPANITPAYAGKVV